MARNDDDGIITVQGGPEQLGNTGDGIVIPPTDGGVADPVQQLADGTVIIDPASIGQSGNSGGSGDTGQRKRGRPRGSGAGRPRSPKSGPQVDITGLENILLSAHAMLAGITKTSELEMEKEEAHKLATAAAGVARHYDMTMSAKALDWTNLIFVVGEVYGTRLAAIRMRRMMERSAKERPSPAAQTAQPRANGASSTVHIPGVGDVSMPVN